MNTDNAKIPISQAKKTIQVHVSIQKNAGVGWRGIRTVRMLLTPLNPRAWDTITHGFTGEGSAQAQPIQCGKGSG